jgi:hypothetical protein
MANAYNRLDQAILDLIEAYSALESEVEEKCAGDEDSYAHAIIEALETSLESSIDESDIATNQFAAILSNLTEALEQLDPSAFEDDEEAGFGLDEIEDMEGELDEEIDYDEEDLEDEI